MIEDTSIFEYFKLKGLAEGVMIDVGAHVDTSSRRYAELGWQIVCFEPEPDNFRELSERLGGYDNVRLVAKAVSVQDQTDVPFYVSDDHWGIHTLKPFHSTHRAGNSVQTVRLDTFLREQSIASVDFLKIDVEGADFLALQSMDFDSFRPSIVMTEFMDSRTREAYGHGYVDIVQHMADRNYDCYVFEYTPVVEYGRKNGSRLNRPALVGASRYPLDHVPDWGNLVFFPRNEQTYELALRKSMDTIHRWSWLKASLRRQLHPTRDWLKKRLARG